MRLSFRHLVLATLAVTAQVPAAASNASAPATVAAACKIPDGGEHLGPTYLTSLTATGTTCGIGLEVVGAYHACQLKHGGAKGNCSSTVDGFRCTEKRGPSIPTEYYSSVACQDRSARVSYKYSQFT
jgi:hypothetical protein